MRVGGSPPPVCWRPACTDQIQYYHNQKSGCHEKYGDDEGDGDQNDKKLPISVRRLRFDDTEAVWFATVGCQCCYIRVEASETT